MVWSCFCYDGVGLFHQVKGIVDKHVYHGILQQKMFPSAKMLFGNNDWIFMHNNPKHKAHMNTLFRKQECSCIGMASSIPWSEPIENLWMILAQKTKERKCRNEDELFRCLENAWNGLERKHWKNWYPPCHIAVKW